MLIHALDFEILSISTFESLVNISIISKFLFVCKTEYGVEKSVALDGLTADQITEKVKELVRAGAEISAKTGS